MMHGMTGTSEMMRPFAEKVLPEGWNLLVPQAEFSHQTGVTLGGVMKEEIIRDAEF